MKKRFQYVTFYEKIQIILQNLQTNFNKNLSDKHVDFPPKR